MHGQKQMEMNLSGDGWNWDKPLWGQIGMATNLFTHVALDVTL